MLSPEHKELEPIIKLFRLDNEIEGNNIDN